MKNLLYIEKLNQELEKVKNQKQLDMLFDKLKNLVEDYTLDTLDTLQDIEWALISIMEDYTINEPFYNEIELLLELSQLINDKQIELKYGVK